MDSFTERERDVLNRLVQTGESNKEIGLFLGMSEGSVKVHMRSILRKSGCRSRAELVLRHNCVVFDGAGTPPTTGEPFLAWTGTGYLVLAYSSRERQFYECDGRSQPLYGGPITAFSSARLATP